MIDNERQLREVIKVLNEEDVLTKTILIGSWCLLFCKQRKKITFFLIKSNFCPSNLLYFNK